jgi:hypothetical protein
MDKRFKELKHLMQLSLVDEEMKKNLPMQLHDTEFDLSDSSGIGILINHFALIISMKECKDKING